VRRAALGGADRVEADAVDVERERAGLADRRLDAGEVGGVVLDEPVRAGVALVLLVGDERQHDVAARAAALDVPAVDHGQRHGGHVLHVHGAAAVDEAVADLAAERVEAPLGGVGGHDVEVGLDEDRGQVGVGAVDAREDVGAARGRFEQRGWHAVVVQDRGHVLGGLAFARAVAAAAVGGVEPDQLRAQLRHVQRHPHTVSGPLRWNRHNPGRANLVERTRLRVRERIGVIERSSPCRCICPRRWRASRTTRHCPPGWRAA
jgi:hypothetical protein